MDIEIGTILEYDEIIDRSEYTENGYIAPYYLKTYKFEILPFNRIEKSIRTDLINLLNETFKDTKYTEQFIRLNWQGLNIFYVMITTENKLVGCIAIDRRNMNPFISNLYILEEYRNKGYGKYLINYSNKYIKRLGYTYSRLWCDDNLKSYYENNGWIFENKINNKNIMIYDITNI